ncbi:E3 ubiquitin-protein ligase RNF128a [Thalassophryne amazonica]|uniref:E3 ubiquitin-protein ligase RNF128a n=1 Tax=Thalassophryne amazonica TaxID=390379 RepID=UPI0014715819|nr:E3 ubiquitin-protein ligase RNF128a [Thalassophryne amazonica]
MGKKTQQYLLLSLFLSGLFQCSAAFIFWTSVVEISYSNLDYNKTVDEYCDCGVYGRNSPLESASGIATLPAGDPRGCSLDSFYNRNSSSPPWIALVKRGNCTFSEKFFVAKQHGAAGVVVYNLDGSGNSTSSMSHPEVPDIVAIMIGNIQGMKIVNLIKRGLDVQMLIEVGTAHGPWIDTYWLYFLSIAFFIVTVASITYFVFISAHRLHGLRMQRRANRRLKSEAKKAISQLQMRTLKQSDMEIDSDSHMCAVCIESYKAGDVMTVLTCSHFFHKTCIEPWLLERRTCPMCKCDILKSLGVEEESKENTTFSSPPDVTVITVAASDAIYEVPLTDTSNLDPEHHYDNRAFEGEAEAVRL